MSKWLTVFRSKRDRDLNQPAYACTSCGAQYDPTPTHVTPPNGVCKCEACATAQDSHLFKQNYDQIDWTLHVSTAKSVQPIGHKVRLTF